MKISHYFTSKEREKTIYLKFTQIFCGLLSLFSDYFCAKVKCIGAMLTAVSLAAVVWSHHTTPSIPHLREHHCVTRSNNSWERDYAYSCSSNRKKSKLLILYQKKFVSRPKNILSGNFTAKSRLKRPQPKIRCDLV